MPHLLPVGPYSQRVAARKEHQYATAPAAVEDD